MPGCRVLVIAANSHIHIRYLKMKIILRPLAIIQSCILLFIVPLFLIPLLFSYIQQFDNLMDFKGVRGSFDSQTPSDLNVKTSFYFSTLIITTAGTKNNL